MLISPENHPHKRHIKYKKIDFAHCYKYIMASKHFSTNLERFLRQTNYPLTR